MRFWISVAVVGVGLLAVGCRKGGGGEVEKVVPAEERARTSRFEVGESWGLPGVVVFRSLDLGMALGVRSGGDRGLEVYPVQYQADPSGFADAASSQEGLVLLGKRTYGDGSVSVFRRGGEWLVWMSREGVGESGEVLVGRSSVTAAGSGGVRVFGLRDGEVLRERSFGGSGVRKVKGEGPGRVYVVPSGGESDGLVLDAGSLRVEGRVVTDVSELFWRDGRLVSLYLDVLYDALTGEEVLVLENGLGGGTTVSADGRFGVSLSADKRVLRVLSLEDGRVLVEVTGQGAGALGGGYSIWGEALAVRNGDRYKVFDLAEPSRVIQFWPVWDVEPEGFVWYLEASDGRWAGSLEAAEVRGMDGEGDSGLVGEFVRLVGLGE